MSMLTRKRIIKVAVEETKGTKVAGTLLLQVEDLQINPTAPYEQRPGSGKYLGNDLPGTIGERSGEVSFTTELLSDGTGGLNAGLIVLFQACGFKQTAKAGEVPETYTPTSDYSVMETVSIDVWEDGNKKGLGGCAGTVTIEGDAGKPARLKWELKGVWQEVATEALPTVTLVSALPMKMSVFTLAAESVMISKYALAVGAEVAYQKDSTLIGVVAGIVVNTDPELSIDPEDQLLTGYKFDEEWLAGTESAVVMTFTDGTDTVTITLAKVVAKELKGADREGIKTYDYIGQINNSSGDDAISMAIAAPPA